MGIFKIVEYFKKKWLLILLVLFSSICFLFNKEKDFGLSDFLSLDKSEYLWGFIPQEEVEFYNFYDREICFSGACPDLIAVIKFKNDTAIDEVMSVVEKYDSNRFSRKKDVRVVGSDSGKILLIPNELLPKKLAIFFDLDSYYFSAALLHKNTGVTSYIEFIFSKDKRFLFVSSWQIPYRLKPSSSFDDRKQNAKEITVSKIKEKVSL